MSRRPRVGLFVTCLVDLVRPSIAIAARKLLDQAGCDVEAPRAQTCCGQPAWNSGADGHAKDIARQVIAAFESFDHVVVPSGSCAGMIKRHYPEVFAEAPDDLVRARALAAKTHELMSFLVNRRGMTNVAASCAAKACYHDSCSSLREMGVKREPRRLLGSVAGLELRELADSEVCCGFGGLFAVKHPEISARMGDDKIADALSTGADTLIAGDLGCLLHLKRRAGKRLRVLHAAEVLAGDA